MAIFIPQLKRIGHDRETKQECHSERSEESRLIQSCRGMISRQGLAVAIDSRASFIYDKHEASSAPASNQEGDDENRKH
jgi:hypothetical protein